jgi:hypothetical protein
MEVEVRLRIPNPKTKVIGDDGQPIDHTNVRFRKRINVPSLPQAGERLQLDTRSETLIPCEVVRTDWSEEGGMFVLACRYAGRGMSDEQRDAVMHDSDWKMTLLI